jgi:anti-anti-sigma factor
VYLRPIGSLSSNQAQQLESEGTDLLARGFGWLVLDLRQTTSIGPAGIAAIAGLARRVRLAGARLTTRSGPASVMRTLQRSGLLQFLELEGAPRQFFEWSR